MLGAKYCPVALPASIEPTCASIGAVASTLRQSSMLIAARCAVPVQFQTYGPASAPASFQYTSRDTFVPLSTRSISVQPVGFCVMFAVAVVVPPRIAKWAMRMSPLAVPAGLVAWTVLRAPLVPPCVAAINVGVIALSRYRFVTTEVGPIVCPADHWSEENLQVQLLYVGS